MQSALFDSPPLPGLIYRPHLVGGQEEHELLAGVSALEFAPFRFQGWEGKRRTVSFGWSYDFNGGGLQPAPPIPRFLLPLRDRAALLAGVAAEAFVHALVIEYAAGAGIGWHRDRPAFGVVCGISLVAPCTLRFRKRDGKRFERASLELEPGSAYVLSGPARHEWEHSIAPLDQLRYSVTFRTLKNNLGSDP
jgi:DNA oxidative demethylase